MPKTKAVTKRRKAPVTTTPVSATPADLLALAIGKDLDVEKLERLVKMQQEWEANQARKEFFAAMMQFQSAAPVLIRDSLVDFKTKSGVRTRYKFAGLHGIRDKISEPLKDAGFSFRYEMSDSGSSISMACIITHTAGHSERTSMTAPADASGGKNAIQARGSTVTYLQRYTLLCALGLVTANEDDDGRAAAKPATEPAKAKTITAAQAKSIKALIKSRGFKPAEMLKYYEVKRLEDLPAERFAEALNAVKQRTQKPAAKKKPAPRKPQSNGEGEPPDNEPEPEAELKELF